MDIETQKLAAENEELKQELARTKSRIDLRDIEHEKECDILTGNMEGFQREACRLREDLTTSRAAMDKMRQEADRYHMELIAAREVVAAVSRMQTAAMAWAAGHDRALAATYQATLDELKTLPLPLKEA